MEPLLRDTPEIHFCIKDSSQIGFLSINLPPEMRTHFYTEHFATPPKYPQQRGCTVNAVYEHIGSVYEYLDSLLPPRYIANSSEMISFLRE